jgi:hypothetical protein
VYCHATKLFLLSAGRPLKAAEDLLKFKPWKKTDTHFDCEVKWVKWVSLFLA